MKTKFYGKIIVFTLSVHYVVKLFFIIYLINHGAIPRDHCSKELLEW